jgi:hypothetical protein
MQLKGKRVLLEKPEMKESPIKLTEGAKEEIEKEAVKLWTSLTVSAIGDEVTSVKPGDKVFVSKQAIQGCEVIQIEEKLQLIINEASIIIIW